MPAKIGPDGKPIVVETEIYKPRFDDDDATAPYNADSTRRAPKSFADDDATEPLTKKSQTRTIKLNDETEYSPEVTAPHFSGDTNAPTIPIDGQIDLKVGAGATSAPAPLSIADDEEVTQVFRGNRSSASSPQPVVSAPNAPVKDEQSSAMQDPPVGWLVVVDGPGLGNFVTIHYGQNDVGRKDGRANLNFGDTEISRESHVKITCDQRSGLFFVSPGNGKSLGYLNESPILDPRRLGNRDKLSLGATTVMFVSLVGEDFAW